MAMEMAMGARRERRKGRQVIVERHHGGIGPLEELWRPGQLAKDVAGKSLVDGMLLERVGPAALFCLPAASTPCMGGLLCAPSGEVGRRGNFCLLYICVFIVVVIAAVGSTDLLPSPKVKCQTRSCVAHFYSAGDRCWHGNGGGGSTVHCSCNDLEISRTYGSTQTSTSRMLRERLVCGTPCAHTIVLTLTTTQSSHPW